MVTVAAKGCGQRLPLSASSCCNGEVCTVSQLSTCGRRLVQRQVRAVVLRGVVTVTVGLASGVFQSVEPERSGVGRFRVSFVRDAHLHGSLMVTAPTGGGVRLRSVRARCRRNGHGLRNVPVGRGEGQGRLVQRQVRVRWKGHADGHVARWPGAQDEGVRVGPPSGTVRVCVNSLTPTWRVWLLTGNTHYRATTGSVVTEP